MDPKAWFDLLQTPTPADLILRPRPGTLSVAELDKRCALLEPSLPADAADPRALRALLLLWHDHWEPAHALAQQVGTAEGSLVHALVHRREPDPWNAKYWWRRTGDHPAFLALGRRVRLRRGQPTGWDRLDELVKGDRWDPIRFVDLVEAVIQRGSEIATQQVCLLQKLEFETVLATFLGCEPIEAPGSRPGSA